jgi:hypothetical protein
MWCVKLIVFLFLRKATSILFIRCIFHFYVIFSQDWGDQLVVFYPQSREPVPLISTSKFYLDIIRYLSAVDPTDGSCFDGGEPMAELRWRKDEKGRRKSRLSLSTRWFLHLWRFVRRAWQNSTGILLSSVPDPGSGAFLSPGSGSGMLLSRIRIPDKGY